MHGDEGSAKRGRAVLALSWSPLAITGPVLLTKYPFVVIKSEMFTYNDKGTNRTLRSLQKQLVQSLEQLAQPTAQGHSAHVVAWKGDWKWIKEWFEPARSYANSAAPGFGSICEGCLAGSSAEKPWLDPYLERFYNKEDLETAKRTACGPEIECLGDVHAYVCASFSCVVLSIRFDLCVLEIIHTPDNNSW